MKTFLLIIGIVFTQASVFSQSAQDVFTDPDLAVIYIGADYSRTSFVGYADFTDPVKINDYFIGAWNQLLVNEIDKYNVMGAFRITDYTIDIEITNLQNEKANPKTFVVAKAPDRWENSIIDEMVGEYAIDSDNVPSVAFVWIVESLNKSTNLATLNAVFFNTQTREVIYHKTLTGSGKGFGFRNYWVNPYEMAIKMIKKRYNTWSKSYK
ncbi:MAG: hypothetical protein GY751_04900 [Bacteroidetes bacterium]|nr:hypothetical protein [Bacteroidota bacterium]